MANDIRMMAARHMGAEAGRHATQGISQLTVFVTENNWSLRGLSFLGSLAMMVFSLVKVLNLFGMLTDFFGYIINLYSLLFASVMLTLEAKDEWPLVHKTRDIVYSNFGFLRTNLGRGIFEVFIGGLWATTSSIWVFWVGVYVMVVGVVYIVVYARNYSAAVEEEQMSSTLQGDIADADQDASTSMAV